MLQCSSDMRRFLEYYLPTLVWAAVIFILSAFPGNGIDGYSFVVFVERKTAHVTEYAILTGLLLRLYRLHAPERMGEYVWMAMTGALLYAASDEIHQLFVFGRQGKVTDVLIDFVGIALAALAWVLFFRARER